jgi:protein involved in polysaccharide export with SLBB domain
MAFPRRPPQSVNRIEFILMKAIFQILLIGSVFVSGCASSEVKARRETARNDAQAAAAQSNREPELYRIGAGDTLKVEFTYNEELNRTVLVRPDGYISLPLIPDVRVADKTLPETRQLLAKQYAGIVKQPVVAVSLENAGSFKVYVGGEVVKPGVFDLNDGVTALRAIAMAGGAKNTAMMSSVVIIRDQGTRTPQYLIVDLKSSVAKLDAQQDLKLHAKDMVFIPKTWIATADEFVDQYINQLIPFEKTLNVTYFFGQKIY